MTMARETERCCHCDEPTGRAGKGDDSLYDALGNGPLCQNCAEKRRLALIHVFQEYQKEQWRDE